MNLRVFILRACAIGWAASCASCAYGAAADETTGAASSQLPNVPIRFILSFDDGPDGREQDNPTESILATLAENSSQNGIKAIFFVQTRSRDGGATARGRALLESEHAQGHVLALHDGSGLGHPNHCGLSEAVLEQSLSDGMADLVSIVGRPVTLLRPPYWAYNARTLIAYAGHGLAVLLADISANDGKVWGYHGSPRRRSHMGREMARVMDRIRRGEIAGTDDATPIVVAFHDTNDYTAEHLHEYLQMLIDEARRSGLVLAPKPFYDDGAALERAALGRASDAARRADMVPGMWRWLHWLCR